MIDPPVFKNYVNWQGNVHEVITWAKETFNYEIVIEKDGEFGKRKNIDMRDVGDITLGPWTAYGSINGDTGFYYFTEEVDAVAFKLKFL